MIRRFCNKCGKQIKVGDRFFVLTMGECVYNGGESVSPASKPHEIDLCNDCVGGLLESDDGKRTD